MIKENLTDCVCEGAILTYATHEHTNYSANFKTTMSSYITNELWHNFV